MSLKVKFLMILLSLPSFADQISKVQHYKQQYTTNTHTHTHRVKNNSLNNYEKKILTALEMVKLRLKQIK